eukprot:5096714-Amphidinium_carterae.1
MFVIKLSSFSTPLSLSIEVRCGPGSVGLVAAREATMLQSRHPANTKRSDHTAIAGPKISRA